MFGYKGQTAAQLLKDMQSAGLWDTFSAFDKQRAQENPEWGYQLANAKMGYISAQTDADKAKYNQQANDLRSSYYYYGGVTGLDDSLLDRPQTQQTTQGSGITNTVQTPQYVEPAAYVAPQWNDQYGGLARTYLESVTKATSQPFTYTAPAAYQDRYDDMRYSRVGSINNQQPFGYDVEQDPLWNAYKKQYTREGRRATADTLGTVAAATGGIPSSYAVTAAQQAGDYYNAQMTDKIPELEQYAYQKYKDDFARQLSQLDAINAASGREAGNYQINADNAWRKIGTDYDIYRGNIDTQMQGAQLAANLQQSDYSRYAADRDYGRGVYENDRNYGRNVYETDRNYNRGVYESDRDFTRQQTLDQRQFENDDWNRAAAAYQLGDASRYGALGVDTSNDPARVARAIETAQATGDWTAVAALGVDPAYVQELQRLNLLQAQASLADTYSLTANRGRTSSGGGGGGVINTESEPEDTGTGVMYTDAQWEVIQEMVNKYKLDDKNNLRITDPQDWKLIRQAFTGEQLRNLEFEDAYGKTHGIYYKDVRQGLTSDPNETQNTVTYSRPTSGDQMAHLATEIGSYYNPTTPLSSPNAQSGTQQSGTQQSGGLNTVYNYTQAREFMKQMGVPQNVIQGALTESEWNRNKNAGTQTKDKTAATFANYPDYLSSYVNYALGQR